VPQLHCQADRGESEGRAMSLPDNLRVWTQGAELLAVHVGLTSITEVYDQKVLVSIRTESGEQEEGWGAILTFNFAMEGMLVGRRIAHERELRGEGI
jgi:hypothetical protein